MILSNNIILALVAGIFLISCFLTKFLITYLQNKQILDIPNERSSHERPTPRGGGIAVVTSIVIGFIFLSFFKTQGFWVVSFSKYEPLYILIGFVLLALLSWIDDKKGLSSLLRLGFHFVIAGFGLYVMPQEAFFFGGYLPLWADKVLALFLWVWFINLYNFMDGIDGITSIQTISIGIGVWGLIFGGVIPQELGIYGLVLIFSCLGFLVYNWNPARIFLGDVGSVPLGFISCWFLLRIALEGAFFASLIIPAYYIFDATFTLIKRAIERKNVLKAHKEHIYQKSVQRGQTHSQVCLSIAKINIGLIILAAASDFSSKPEAVLIISYIFVATFAFRMLKGEKQPTLKELKDEMINGAKQTYSEASKDLENIKKQKSETQENEENEDGK